MCNFVKIYGNIFLVYVKLILPKRKNKDFRQEKLNKCWKLHLIIPPCIDVTHFLKFFVSLEVTNGHLFRFAFIAFACNVKNFATAIIFFSLFFSTANLNGLTKAAYRTFQICEATRVWLNSDTLEKRYVRNVYSNLKFRV